MLQYGRFAMKPHQSEQFRHFDQKALEHVRQCEKLDELFGLAIEFYIFINSAHLLTNKSLNWTTPDGNGGQSLDAELYARDEEVYRVGIEKMLAANPGRVAKIRFIELVISLALIVNNDFARRAQDTIDRYQLKSLVGGRHHLAKTT